VLAGMRHFAAELEAEGFEVDYKIADSFVDGFQQHCKQYGPDEIVAMEPLSWDGHELLDSLGVEKVHSNQMLCHYDDFSSWAQGSKRLLMENFYRWQRQRLDYLMDGDEPVQGRWNFDSDNREPPPKDGRDWHRTRRSSLDDVDSDVIKRLPDHSVGAEPDGTWPTTRKDALRHLRDFIRHVLPDFGPHEDAMLTNEWRLAHSMLSQSLNLGLLLPHEVADATEEAYRTGDVPIASAEGFLRQVIGWREYIWNVYWHKMPDYRKRNALKANRALPPLFNDGQTEMNCVSCTIQGAHERGWNHHIQRLMIIGNLALISGIEPQELVEWMWATYVDGAEWVMIPNVVGMALYADGGEMSTKPYAAGGAYINRMSDYCKGCTYNPKKRTGDDACPFTTLYWDFLDRHRERFSKNHRMSQQVKGIDRLKDMPEVRERAKTVLEKLSSGNL